MSTRFATVLGCGILVGGLVLLPQLRSVLHGKAATQDLPTDMATPTERVSGQSQSVSRETSPAATTAAAEVFRDMPEAESPFQGEEISWVKTIPQLPTEDYQLQTAHRIARRHACEPIPANEPVVFRSFQPYLTRRDYRDHTVRVPALSRRQPIFSVGLDMIAADQRNLPTLSAGRILAYLRDHYITLQVRVQKEPLSGELFLHHRSLAGVAPYRSTGLTQLAPEGLGVSLKNYRSMGLFLPEGKKPIPRNLRTLVLLHKNKRVAEGSDRRSVTHYEYVFVRAQAKGGRDRRTLDLHTFVTSNRRQQLHYLKPGIKPSHSGLCSFKSITHFTKYSKAGLYPMESGSRGTVFNDRGLYSMRQLEAFAVDQGWEGGVLQNVTQLLDAIIEGQVSE